MDVVADLFPFVSKDSILTPFDVALHQIAQKSVQLDPRMIGPSQTTSPQATGWQVEIPAILLDHDIGGDLRGSEERMFRLVDTQRLRNTVNEFGIIVFPSCIEFLETNRIGAIAVDLIGRHMDER